MDAEHLITAVRAALDDREWIATEALSHPTRWHGGVDERTGTDDGVWRTGSGMDECLVEGIGITIYDEGGHSAEQARHIAANDPAAVLRLVGALREIVERYEFVTSHGPAVDHVRALDMTTGAASALRFAVERLAHGLGIDLEETQP